MKNFSRRRVKRGQNSQRLSITPQQWRIKEARLVREEPLSSRVTISRDS